MAVKLICRCGVPVFNGSNIDLPLTLYPFGQDVRSVTVSGARTAIAGSTAAAQLRQLIINRVLAEYSITLVDDEIVIFGGLQ